MNKIPEHLLYNLYCDGGVIGRNPSLLGGTWAWCLVDNKGKRVNCDSGVVVPKEVGVQHITNNFTELLAVVHGLEAMVKGWRGILYSDSKVTWWRLTTSNKFNGIPGDLAKRCLLLRHNKLWTPILCGGHPKRKHLEVGYDHRGLPVFHHNVWCDQRCTALANRFKKREDVDA